jgi:hypothetical protein
MDTVIEAEEPGKPHDPLPTCASCVAWTGEECRSNPPVPLLVQGQVVTVFPRTAGSAWCLAHESIDDQFADCQQLEGDSNV